MIQSNNARLKAGTEFTYNGEQVWIEHDQENGSVSVCWSKSRGLNDYYEVVSKEDLKPVKVVRTPISNKPKKLTEKDKTDKQLMDMFYLSLHDKIPFACNECHKPLYAMNNFAKRSVSCHIIPKSLFPSVSTVEDNIIYMGVHYLGICDHHTLWDSCIENRVKMKVYQNAIHQFYNFRHLLNDEDLINAYKYLGLTVQAALDYLNSK